MTQLVQLQKVAGVLRSEGVAVYSISYDAPDVLGSFGRREGITFPMLSDVGSVAITRLGLRNEHVHEQAAVFGFKPNPKHEGIPYPGAFALDEAGTITARRFFDLYRERETGPGLIERIFGIETTEGPQRTITIGGTDVSVRLDSSDYTSHQRVWLYADIELAAGSHVFAEGTPLPYVSSRIEVDSVEGIVVGAPEWPAGVPFHLDGAPDELLVYKGRARGAVPLRFFSATRLGDLTVSGRVHLQVCTSTTCDLPGSVEFELPIAEGRFVLPPKRS
jgi:hypothetical protein